MKKTGEIIIFLKNTAHNAGKMIIYMGLSDFEAAELKKAIVSEVGWGGRGRLGIMSWGIWKILDFWALALQESPRREIAAQA